MDKAQLTAVGPGGKPSQGSYTSALQERYGAIRRRLRGIPAPKPIKRTSEAPKPAVPHPAPTLYPLPAISFDLPPAPADEYVYAIPTHPQASVRAIQVVVSQYFGVSVGDLVSHRRFKRITLPRQVAMYLSYETTAQTYPEIGMRFRRDHTTVIHAVRKITALLDAEHRPTVEAIDKITAMLQQPP